MATASARKIAWEILNQVELQGGWAEIALPEAMRRARLPEPEARLCRELTLGVIKSRRYLDYVLTARLSSGTLPRVQLLNLLRLGVYQLLNLSRIPPHAAVHATVALGKELKFPAGLINAVLRGLLRQGPPGLPDAASDPVAHDAVRYSLPEFLVARWHSRYGAAAQAMMEATQAVPPLAIRVNRLQASREQGAARLAASGVVTHPGPAPEALMVEGSSGDPAGFPGFAEGWWYFQDAASQLVGYLVDPQPGETCLDVCAAPGGKATHLAELMADQGQVLAYDLHPGKRKRIAENARRLRLNAVQVIGQLPAGPLADRVLVDAPCSGLGTLRRHAESRWRVSPDDFPVFQQRQLAVLEQGSACVRPGGVLVYATCTTEPEENEDVVQAFLQQHPDFSPCPGPGRDNQPASALWGADGFFRTWPGVFDLDGIFAARLKRKK